MFYKLSIEEMEKLELGSTTVPSWTVEDFCDYCCHTELLCRETSFDNIIRTASIGSCSFYQMMEILIPFF